VTPISVAPHPGFGYILSMSDQPAEKDCCRRTRARWIERIGAYFTSFPVIKDVPCDTCREIIEIRVYEHPAA
jgi:hypothetical protein